METSNNIAVCGKLDATVYFNLISIKLTTAWKNTNHGFNCVGPDIGPNYFGDQNCPLAISSILQPRLSQGQPIYG